MLGKQSGETCKQSGRDQGKIREISVRILADTLQDIFEFSIHEKALSVALKIPKN